MRYAIISDIHSNSVSLNRVLEDLDKRSYDKLICLGDIIGYGPKPKECLNKIREESDIVIQGNHDRMVAENNSKLRLPPRVKKGLEHSEKQLDKSDIKWLDSLDEKKQIDDNVFIAHSHPRIRDKYIYPKDFLNMVPIMNDLSVKFLSLGHTHIQGSKTDLNSGYEILNPGSVGQPRDGNPDAGYAILDTEKEISKLYRCSYDVKKVVSQVKDCKILPNKNGKRLLSGK